MITTMLNILAQAPTQIPLDFVQIGQDGLQGSVETADFGLGFGNWLGNIFGIIMVIALLILLGMLVIGAMGWLTSGGDSSKLENARNRMVHAVIGILILASVLAIFMFVQYLLGIDIFSFGANTQNLPSSGTGFMEWYGQRSTEN